MQNLLDQQQRLALQDKQLLEGYKAEIKDLKALTMAPHDDGEKEVMAQNQRSQKLTLRTHNLNLKSGGVLVNSYN